MHLDLQPRKTEKIKHMDIIQIQQRLSCPWIIDPSINDQTIVSDIMFHLMPVSSTWLFASCFYTSDIEHLIVKLDQLQTIRDKSIFILAAKHKQSFFFEILLMSFF